MDKSLKIAVVLTISIFIVSTSVSIQESATVEQSVTVKVDRANQDIFSKTQLHCMREDIDFCQKNVGVVDVLKVYFGLYDKKKVDAQVIN